MDLKAQDADRMNFENDQFLRRQQQIMQLELAEANNELPPEPETPPPPIKTRGRQMSNVI